jgi:hypothetical protein
MAHKSYIADDCALEARQASPTLVITESNDKLTDTGLLDSSGNKLYRPRTSIGFVRYES